MKDLFFKIAPVVVGFICGYFLIFPPEFLGFTLFVRICLLIPLAAIGLLFFFAFLISASMPANVEMTPIDQRRVTASMIDLFNEYQNAGFELAGAPLRIGTKPPAVLVPLADPERPMYGTIYRTGTDPPVTSSDIVTIFSPYSGLTTGNKPEGAALPAAPGSFYQIFPGADVATMRQKHMEALTYLQRQGLQPKPATAQDFPGEFRKAIAKMRSHFWTNPIWHTLVVVYRSSTQTTPHMGPIQQQPIAQRTLQQLQQSVG
jgi:hypothetical protein